MNGDDEFLARFFGKVKKYVWKPQPDITTHELAQCVPAAALGHVPNPHITQYVENLPIECRRHFKEVEPE